MSAAPPPAITPGSLRAWVLAMRPATLTAAVTPVLVGTAVAYVSGAVRVGAALAALGGAMLFQIASNFANDVFDAEKGADTHERLGPTRAVQAGLLTPRQVRTGLAIVIALSMPIGVYLAWIAGWPVIAIGVASILSAVAYTGGPYPLGYHGLGDVFVFLFFGLVAVVGTVFVELGQTPPLAWLAATPVGAIATAVLVVNNVRDRATDVGAGKRTIAVRFGRSVAIGEYAALLVVAYAAPLVAVLWLHRAPWVLLPVLSMPMAIGLTRKVATLEGRPLNAVLVATAKLLLLFGTLFAIGIVLGR